MREMHHFSFFKSITSLISEERKHIKIYRFLNLKTINGLKTFLHIMIYNESGYCKSN